MNPSDDPEGALGRVIAFILSLAADDELDTSSQVHGDSDSIREAAYGDELS